VCVWERERERERERGLLFEVWNEREVVCLVLRSKMCSRNQNLRHSSLSQFGLQKWMKWRWWKRQRTEGQTTKLLTLSTPYNCRSKISHPIFWFAPSLSTASGFPININLYFESRYLIWAWAHLISLRKSIKAINVIENSIRNTFW
jgi:hypothetical protein